ncbi:MAG: benzoate/H(+) symporter BenE family transporter [Nocardioidaceae bacterium]
MSRSRPITAGLVASLVGFTSSYAVVLAGLRSVGASPAQAASGLLALFVTQGVGGLWLTWRTRLPVLLAWSTPGAALLAGATMVAGGWPAAVGAFLAVGVLILLTALWPRLGALIASIPVPIAQAMLAGVLLPLCIEPVHALAAHPAYVAPIVLSWLALLVLAPRWAVPGAFVVCLIGVLIGAAHGSGIGGSLTPRLTLTEPTFTWAALLGIALPLYVVTMASQNVPGVAVLASFGYEAPWRPAMTVTGIGTLVGAPAGGHAINLAAITAAIVAAPEADPDRDRRWIAAATTGIAYLVLAPLSAALVAVADAAPDGVFEAVAGIALLATLGGALGGATTAAEGREAAIVTLVVAASGVTFAGVGAAFWALVAGLLVHHVLAHAHRRSHFS